MVCAAVPMPHMAIPYLAAVEPRRNRPKISKARRLRIYERDQGICQLCGEKVEPRGGRRRRPSLDHIKRVRDGGTNQDANLRLVHQSCNEERERLALIEEYGVYPSWWTTGCEADKLSAR